ncbi:MAG: hypothetical protein R6X19_06330 [Kiritimatiellia bacterium]
MKTVRSAHLIGVLAFGLAVGGVTVASGEPPTQLRAADAAGDNTGKLRVRSYALNPYNSRLDGQWQGIIVASDSNCYFASSTHAMDSGSALFKYNPLTRELTCRQADMSRIDGNMGAPTEKIHTDMKEVDGWIYFASRWGLAAPGKKGEGGQVIGYELATGAFRNYGIVHPGHGIYAGLAADSFRKCIWVITVDGIDGTEESRLYRIAIATGEKTQIARFTPGGSCLFMVVDRRGDCWFTIRTHPGVIFRARADQSGVDRFENAFSDGDSGWDFAQLLPDGDRAVVLTGLTTLARDAIGKFRLFDMTRAGKPGAMTLIKAVGTAGLGNVVSGNRIYFIQRPDGRYWARRSGVGGGDGDLRLNSIELRADGRYELVNHGTIVDQDGRVPLRLHSLAVDEQGRAYMVGDWELLPGERASDKSTDRVGRGVLNRGQFFAVADIKIVRQGDSAVPLETASAKQGANE